MKEVKETLYKIEQQDKRSRAIGWVIVVILVSGMILTLLNQAKLSAQQTKLNRKAILENRLESQHQHDAQDAKFECLIKLFVSWTDNGQRPIGDKDVRNCIVRVQ